MSVENRTQSELDAQGAKRRRRYAASVGKGYCQLTIAGHMCPDLGVKQLAGVDVCAHHVKVLEEIERDAHKKRSVAA